MINAVLRDTSLKQSLNGLNARNDWGRLDGAGRSFRSKVKFKAYSEIS